MGRIILVIMVLLLSCASISYGQEGELVDLEGISLGMKKGRLLDNWGFPAKRDHKIRTDVWFYANDNTPHPTDGIVVYFKKDRVENWRVVDNIYSEMEIWGKAAGRYP